MKTFKPILFFSQFFVALLFWLGFKQLYFFFDLNLVEFIATMGVDRFSALTTDNFAIGERLSVLLWVKVILSYSAVFVTYIINSYINYKNGDSWLNSFVIALVLVVLQLFNLLDLPTHWFLSLGVKFRLIAPVAVCLGLSSIIYYRWISKIEK